ncbi:hypothetical protein QTI17_21440 [Variovorax sp. J31P179]|uniref:hypothetical protein n=1 Tax=Variovorax sp. J31P179 TaxID=3053508 RepID=UPI0025765EC0|nr:hypothetical protein [Variovorax sp. J31P179]MDM0083164.1 hypothetical protein [Variovorax sp. J31P179]
MPDLDQLLTTATNPTTPARVRVRAACAVLDALKPPKASRASRRPVARSPDELRAALEVLQARRAQLER